jgi:hypothetical protein
VIEKLTKNVNEEHLREIFGVYGQIRDLDMPINRNCKITLQCAVLSLTSQSTPTVEQPTSSTPPKPTPRPRLLICTNLRSTEPSLTSRLSFHAASSPRHHLSQDAARISTLVDLQQPVSALLLPRDAEPLLQAMADLRGTLIHTGPDRSLVPAPQDAIELAQDQSLRDLDPRREDGEDAEIALLAMEAEEEGARVIAATAVMTIEAGVAAVDGVAVADVSGSTLDFNSVGVWDDKKNCNIDFKIPMTPIFSDWDSS